MSMNEFGVMNYDSIWTRQISLSSSISIVQNTKKKRKKVREEES